MAAGDKDVRTEPTDEDEDETIEQSPKVREAVEERNENLIDKPGVKRALLDIYKDIEKGYQDQYGRANDQLDYWDMYHCELNANQFYNGNSKIFTPIVHDAVNARKTRFVNQMFPVSGKHVEVSAAEDKPMAIMSLLEHYIRKARLRTSVMPALMKKGDVEGQYNIYIHWVKNTRHVAMRVKKSPSIDAVPIDDSNDYDDLEEDTITHQYPVVEVLPDADVLVLPHTADSIEEAIRVGGSATIIRRWSKVKIKKAIRDKDIEKEAGEALLSEMSKQIKSGQVDPKKDAVDAAGIKYSEGKWFTLVYETWAELNIQGERKICRIYFGSEESILSCKRNPFWCDKIPLISAPVEKEEGAFKGISKLKPVQTYQYAANDAINEAMDSAAYALLPIVMTDPAKNPRVGSMILSVAAVWETDPNSTKFAQMPQLWKDGFAIVSSAKDQIFQTLGVNPSMMPQQATAPGKKPNQAVIANEQQVDILTTADAVTTVEGEILTPMLKWFLWLDHQYRTTELSVPQFGVLGVKAEMEKIEPIQMDRRFEFRWFGVEAARNAQMIQQQMAGINVVMKIPPQAYQGYKLTLAPVIMQFIENLFGPTMASQIFEDERKKMTLEASFENEMLEAGYDLPVNVMDDDGEHMKAHMQILQEKGDIHGKIRGHLMKHRMQMQLKMQQAKAQQVQQLAGPQGPQGGGGGQRTGAKSNGPRGGQQPPGAIHQDQIRDPAAMPRGRMG